MHPQSCDITDASAKQKSMNRRPKDCEPAIVCNGELASDSRVGNSNAIEQKINKYIKRVTIHTQTHKSARINTDAHTKRTRKEEGAQRHDALLLP